MANDAEMIIMQVDPTEAEKVMKSAECVSVMPSRRRGRWIADVLGSHTCTACGMWVRENPAKLGWKFCPYCGAHMDLKETEYAEEEANI